MTTSTATDPERIRTIIGRLNADPEARQANWCLSPEGARLIYILVRTGGFSRILEVGTSIGFSTLHMAWGLWENQQINKVTELRIDTIDASQERQETAIANLREAGLEGFVNTICGEALPALTTLAERDARYHLMFLDAQKSEYIDYFGYAQTLVEPGGLLVADNTQSHRQSMRDFLEAIENHPAWLSTDLPTPGGLLIGRKR